MASRVYSVNATVEDDADRICGAGAVHREIDAEVAGVAFERCVPIECAREPLFEHAVQRVTGHVVPVVRWAEGTEVRGRLLLQLSDDSGPASPKIAVTDHDEVGARA